MEINDGRPLLVCDIDGCLADQVEASFRMFADHGITNFRPADRWEYYLDYADGEHLFKRFLTGDSGQALIYWKTARPIPGAVDAIQALSEHYRVVYGTYRSEALMEVTQEWLHDHGICGEVFHVRDKSTLNGDVYIDDHDETIFNMATSGKARYILFDQPWNRTPMAQTFLNQNRMTSWDSIVKLLVPVAERHMPEV